MKSKMENLVAMHDAAKLEAKTGREELKRARKEWLKMKDELDAEREAHKLLKVGWGGVGERGQGGRGAKLLLFYRAAWWWQGGLQGGLRVM